MTTQINDYLSTNDFSCKYEESNRSAQKKYFSPDMSKNNLNIFINQSTPTMNPTKVTSRISSASTNIMNSRKNISKKISRYPHISLKNDDIFDDYSKITNKSTKYKLIQPLWKYTYYVDPKTKVMNIRTNFKETAQYIRDDYSLNKRIDDINKRKPRIQKILENNEIITEEIKSHYWKYEDYFRKKKKNYCGKLLHVFMNNLYSTRFRRVDFNSFNSDYKLNFFQFKNDYSPRPKKVFLSTDAFKRGNYRIKSASANKILKRSVKC